MGEGELRLRPIAPAERAELFAAADRYLAELATHREIAAGPVDAASHAYLPLYWSEAGRHPFWIERAGRRVGFVLVRRVPPDAPTRSELSELYVEPAARRRGVGRAAAGAAFRRFGGAWELQVHWRNGAARAFWRDCIATVADDDFAAIEVDAEDRRRIEYRFSVRS